MLGGQAVPADAIFPYFERLRRDTPFTTAGISYGYWSVSCYEDIVEVEADHSFSSDARLGGVTISDLTKDFMLPMFIAADPPAHRAAGDREAR